MKMDLSTKGMEELTEALLKLGGLVTYGPAVREALTLASEAAVECLRESSDKYHGGGTGQMRDSITASKPNINENGGYVTITLKGAKAKNWRYRDQGAELNYGSGGEGTKRKRKASHWFDKGQEKAQPEVERILTETLEAWIESAGNSVA